MFLCIVVAVVIADLLLVNIWDLSTTTWARDANVRPTTPWARVATTCFFLNTH